MDTVGWATPRSSAARETLPVSATATNVRNVLGVITPSRRGVGWALSEFNFVIIS
jgi:hypothetical protein